MSIAVVSAVLAVVFVKWAYSLTGNVNNVVASGFLFMVGAAAAIVAVVCLLGAISLLVF